MKLSNETRRGKTLLLVEDDVLTAMALRDELGDAGYRVLELTISWEEAIAAVLKDKPDLALVNIQLEGRPDGVALASELKAMGVPSLFISGQVDRAKSARSVAVGSMPKPYSVTDMRRAVDYFLLRTDGQATSPVPPGLEVFLSDLDGITPQAA